ncbi:MAG TPA: TIGR00374 family protein [Algoriphagus sp.]|uniref:lysylphosphatidylglycerol synthase transmembrane domain-containing protein n=3 Tax=Algoriphagus TaxID=246875 RepID=UPI000C400240|nr:MULTISPECIES: lysylphosphatidylglycerol synthase transmembrane domain-containing protein [unclassified Algoriphagus]MAL13625.1 TIGR00374 family protein [Algoriphagus sp.]QYH39955.1 flippase-like domain-containing protein [Algoriphagus sp. NBT04N3]HAH37468.1 TIGR00374 family protein [Algoriphagus sp.]HCB46335.1 TIGR00374 family protein [Algoriphagus sp.]HCD87554.1 TIGR00374 family protein [Algoriphagus sp.]
MTRYKNQLKTILKLILTGLALYLVFRKIDTAQLFEILKTIQWIWLVPAVILFVLSKVATAVRLNQYFKNISLQLSEWKNWKLYLIGMFYNLFLPGGIGGDGYKVYLLNKHFKLPVKKLLQAALLDRLGGLVAIVFLLFGLFLIVEVELDFLESELWNGLMVAGLILTVPGFWLVQKLFFKDFLPSFWSANAWSFAGQLAQLIFAWFILMGLGIHNNILAYQLVFLLSSIVAVLPLTIGGVGARELVFVYAHQYAGIEETAAVAFSLIFFLISAAVSLMGALVKVDLDKNHK